MAERKAELSRASKETDIAISLVIDGSGKTDISTGIGFFDHMLTAFAFHAGFDLTLKAKGDLEVDQHHTVEDTGILLGKAIAAALGKERRIERYGESAVPMDEALVRTVLDISGRPYLVFQSGGLEEKGVYGFDASLVREFLRAVVFNAGITAHIRAEAGDNGHHIAEAAFKSFGRALRTAVRQTESVRSTKGLLD